MKKMLKRLNSQEGFTLAELLIVVAIIAILVAVSIPVFNSQLEKARESTDAANIRAIYAELNVDVLNRKTGTATHNPASSWSVSVDQAGGTCTGIATYKMTQLKAGTSDSKDITIGGVKIGATQFGTGTCTITIKDDGTTPTIVIN